MRKKLYSVIVIAAIVGLTGCSSSRTENSYAQARLNFAEQNYHDAYQQLLVPAAKGNPDAEYALGYLYYYGKGTPANTELGKQWILKAAQDGNEQAAQAYQMIMAKEQGIMPEMASPAPVVHHPKAIAYAKPIIKKQAKKSMAQARHTGAKTSAEKQLLAAKKTDYTIQLIDATSAANAAGFIKKQQLNHNARYFHRQLNGKDLYVVVYGIYANKTLANNAVKTLPKKVQQLRPWVRSIASVQTEIKNV